MGFDSLIAHQINNCGLAQLVEHATLNRDVAGSNPASTASFITTRRCFGSCRNHDRPRAQGITDCGVAAAVTPNRTTWTLCAGRHVLPAPGWLDEFSFNGGCSLAGRALGCDPGRRRFESVQSPQFSVALPERSKGAACKAVARRFESGTPLQCYLALAQLEERDATNVEAAGSSPAGGSSYAVHQVIGHPPLTVGGVGRRALRQFRSVGKWHAACFGSRSSGVRFTPLRPVFPPR
jgi:hypothetical protein